MRIAIISTYFPPTNSIAAQRAFSWAKQWSLQGQDVTVVTTAVAEPNKEDMQDFVPKGYRVIRVFLPKVIQKIQRKLKGEKKLVDKGEKSKKSRVFAKKIKEKTGVFSTARMPDFFDFWVSPACKQLKDEPVFDVIISTSGPYACHLVAERLFAQGKAKKWIADFRDLWTEHQAYRGLWPFCWLEKWLEKRIVKRCSVLTTVSEPLAKALQKKSSRTVHVVENGVDFQELSSLPIAPFWSNTRFRIVYTGTFYLGFQNPLPLFSALRQLPDHCREKIDVIFAGRYSKPLQEMIEEQKVKDCVSWVGFCKREDALRMQRDADLVLFLPWSQKQKGILTGKIFEYAASKTPVISVGGAVGDDADLWIQKWQVGDVFQSDVEKIKNFLENSLLSSTKKKISPNSQFYKRFDRAILAEKMLATVGPIF